MNTANSKRYLLAILTVTLAFNFVDRFALGLLLQNIKVDLALSDTQLGVLTGIAFALFYSVMGIPIARWADRGNRITIMSVTIALWSGALALCGLVSNFLQLLAVRVGVAVGEAGCIPPAHSLIADHFSRDERPKATASFMLGAPASVVIGYFLAGWLNEFYGWRATFLILGLPGLLLAALVRFTLREPRLRVPAASASGIGAPARREVSVASVAAPQPSIKNVFVFLWSNRTFRHLLISFSIMYFFGFGIQQWKPAFFVRSHGMTTGELGTWLALIHGLGGILGTYCGGEWAQRYAANNERLQLRFTSIAYSSFAVISGLVFLSPNRYMAFGFLALAAVGGAVAAGPLFATIQTLVPQHMRAMSIAVVYLFANLIGMGLGPLSAGALSDVLRPWAADESLRYALLILCPGYLWAGWHLWQASRSVTRDLKAAEPSPPIAIGDEDVVLDAPRNA